MDFGGHFKDWWPVLEHCKSLDTFDNIQSCPSVQESTEQIPKPFGQYIHALCLFVARCAGWHWCLIISASSSDPPQLLNMYISWFVCLFDHASFSLHYPPITAATEYLYLILCLFVVCLLDGVALATDVRLSLHHPTFHSSSY